MKYSNNVPPFPLCAFSVQTCALRELKEETGYVGKVIGSTGRQYLSPGLTNENLVTVFVKVSELMQDQALLHPAAKPCMQLPFTPSVSASQHPRKPSCVHALVQVDMDAPENQNPQQCEEDQLMGIQLDTLPLDNLYQSLQELETQGYAIWVGLWSIALAMNLNNLIK